MVRRVGAPQYISAVQGVVETGTSPARSRAGPTSKATKTKNVDEPGNIWKTGKPSEVRATLRSGARATTSTQAKTSNLKQKAYIGRKQDRVLKEQKQGSMVMHKIRAEIEAIKERERALNEGKITKLVSKSKPQEARKKTWVVDKFVSALKEDDENVETRDAGYGTIGRKVLAKEKRGQFQRAVSRENIFKSSSIHVPEMRRKPTKKDLMFCSNPPSSLSKVKQKQPQLVQTPEFGQIVRKGGLIQMGPQKQQIYDKYELAKKEEEKQELEVHRKKLEEAKKCFETGYEACWTYQDSHRALVKYRKTLFIREELLGKYHEDTGKTYYWIGRSLAKLKEFDEALVAFSRAMRIFGRVLAQNHKYRKWTSAAIEEVFKEVKDPDVDYELYMSALADSIAQEVKGDNLRKNKQFEKAITEYRLAILTVPEYHPDCADLHSKIAIALRAMGEFKLALEENRFALEIYELSFGPKHPETIKTLNQTMEKKRLDQVSLALREKLNIKSK